MWKTLSAGDKSRTLYRSDANNAFYILITLDINIILTDLSRIHVDLFVGTLAQQTNKYCDFVIYKKL